MIDLYAHFVSQWLRSLLVCLISQQKGDAFFLTHTKEWWWWAKSGLYKAVCRAFMAPKTGCVGKLSVLLFMTDLECGYISVSSAIFPAPFIATLTKSTALFLSYFCSIAIILQFPNYYFSFLIAVIKKKKQQYNYCQVRHSDNCCDLLQVAY